MSGPVHLNRKLILQEAVRSPDGAGGYREDWLRRGMLWAAIRAGTGRESGADIGALSRLPWRIIIRAAPMDAPSRPHPGQRFLEGRRVFRILAVAEHDAPGRYLVCHAIQEEVSR